MDYLDKKSINIKNDNISVNFLECISQYKHFGEYKVLVVYINCDWDNKYNYGENIRIVLEKFYKK